MPFDNLPQRHRSPSDIEIMIDQLERARDYLAPRWGRGSMGFQGDRRTCAVGALFVVSKARFDGPLSVALTRCPANRAQVEALAKALYPAIPRHTRILLGLLSYLHYRHTKHLIIYNDTHSRDSVFKLFDRTIARLRAEAYCEHRVSV